MLPLLLLILQAMATNILNLNVLCFYFMTKKSYEGATTGAALEYQTRGWFGVGLQSTRPDAQTMTKQEVLKAEGGLYSANSALWIRTSQLLQ